MPAAVLIHYDNGVYSTDSDNYEEPEEGKATEPKAHLLMQMVGDSLFSFESLVGSP